MTLNAIFNHLIFRRVRLVDILPDWSHFLAGGEEIFQDIALVLHSMQHLITVWSLDRRRQNSHWRRVYGLLTIAHNPKMMGKQFDGNCRINQFNQNWQSQNQHKRRVRKWRSKSKTNHVTRKQDKLGSIKAYYATSPNGSNSTKIMGTRVLSCVQRLLTKKWGELKMISFEGFFSTVTDI